MLLLIKKFESKIQNTLTLRERLMSGSAAFPDICGRRLQRHVRRLADPDIRRLHFLGEKNKWLYDLVMDKLSRDEARYYAEPIYLLNK